MTSANELAALADEIERSDGLIVMHPIAVQLGIKKTAQVVSALRATSTSGVREAYSALFEPEESDAFDNLEGALIDIERLSADGKPTDEVCIRTIKRVLDQLNTAYSRMQGVLASSPTNSEWNAVIEAVKKAVYWLKYGDAQGINHLKSLQSALDSLHRGERTAVLALIASRLPPKSEVTGG